MSYKYKFLVDGTNLSCVGCEEVPTGNAGVLECEFAFASDPGLKYWYCSFRKAGKVRNVEIEGGRCSFSDDMLTKEGKLFIGVFGSNLENGTGFKRVSTNFVPIDVERGAYQAALGKVTPSLWEQYAGKVTDVEEGLDKHKRVSVLDHPDESVTGSKIADGAVSGDKLEDRAVGYEKLALGVRGLMFKGEVNPAFMADELNDSSARGIYRVQDDFNVGPEGGASELGDGLLIVQTREVYEESEVHLEGMWQTRIKSNGVVMTRKAKTIVNDVVTEWGEWSEPYLSVGAPTFKGDINVHFSSAYDELNTIDADGIYRTYSMDYTHNMRVTEGILIVSAELYPEGGLDYIRQCRIDSLGCIQRRESIKKEGDTVTEWSDWRGDYAVGEKGAILFGTNVFDEEDIAIATDDNAFEVKKSGEVKSPTIDDLYQRTDAGVIVCAAEGEYINVNDSAEMPLKSLRALGKTEQVKTEGKNVIPFPAFKAANGNNGMNYVPGHTEKINGVTFIVNDDGSITFNGTASMKTTFTMVYNYNKNPYMQLTPGRTYRITSNYNYPEASGTTFNANMLIRQYKADGTYVDKYLMNSVMARTHTIDEEYVSAYLYTCQLIVAAGYTANNVTIYVMLEEGETESPYEPYTGGKPSPSPEWKQPLKTAVVAEEFIQLEVSNEAKERIQSVILSPFNGLWGVPVSSGGNYTDSDGQQWICNELDLVRGVYIERVVHEIIGTLPTVYTAGTTADGKTIYAGYYNTTGIAEGAGLCTVASYVDSNSFGSSGNAEMSVFNAGADLFEVAFSYATTDEDSFRNIFEGQEIILLKKAPTETPFSADVLAQCKALHSYNPTTNIVNDKGALMVVEYVADTKTYIDNKFAALEAAVISLGGNV